MWQWIYRNEFGQPIRTNEECRKYSKACLEMCLEENIKAIDLWNLIQRKDNWKNVCIFDDGIHLTAKGNEIVSNEILKVLKVAEWKPSLYWMEMPPEFGEDSSYDPISSFGVKTNISNIPFPYHLQWDNPFVSKL